MELWQDQGILLGVKPHGENGAIVSLLTQGQGRHAGYVRGTHGTKLRGVLECGNLLDVHWSSRTTESLGTFALELVSNFSARVLSDPLRLLALQAACGLCDAALPEREAHAGLFHGLLALFSALETDVWAPAYIMWEMAFLRELGFSLDLRSCAGGGSVQDLAYVSPKTGRAVSTQAGEPYKDRLLPLADFLTPQGGAGAPAEVLKGLEMTGYFLEHWAFIHHMKGTPEARLRLEERFRLQYGHSFAKEEEGRPHAPDRQIFGRAGIQKNHGAG